MTSALGCGDYKVPYFAEDFGDDAIGYELPYDPCGEAMVYEGKTPISTQRPWVELGRPFYDWGQFPAQLHDFRRCQPRRLASSGVRRFPHRDRLQQHRRKQRPTSSPRGLNLELDWKVTSTERFHTSFQPMNKGQDFTRVEFGGSDDSISKRRSTSIHSPVSLRAIWVRSGAA